MDLHYISGEMEDDLIGGLEGYGFKVGADHNILLETGKDKGSGLLVKFSAHFDDDISFAFLMALFDPNLGEGVVLRMDNTSMRVVDEWGNAYDDKR